MMGAGMRGFLTIGVSAVMLLAGWGVAAPAMADDQSAYYAACVKVSPGLKTACEALLAKGIQPIFEPVADGWHHVLWFNEIGPRYEEEKPGLADELNVNKATFGGNEAMLSAVTELKDLYDSGCFGKNALADTFADRTKVMATGQVTVRHFTTAHDVVLIAAVNIANLALVRSNGRMKELATRNAIGAGQARIARQLMTEATLLTVAGASMLHWTVSVCAPGATPT